MPSRPGSSRKRFDTPTAVGDIVPSALRELGIPSARLSRRVREAWDRAVDPGWRGQTSPHRLEGGVLVIGVRSASLRQELTMFHRDRLLSVLRAALPDVPLVALRFQADDAPDSFAGEATGEVR